MRSLKKNPTFSKTLAPVLFALTVAILPHLARLPLWIILWCGGLWGYVLVSLKFDWPAPGKWVRGALTAIGLAGLFLTYTIRSGADAYLGLLAVMAGLKPLEVRTHRDRMVTVFMAYFIVITSLFQSETLAITLYMFVSVGVTTGVLIRVNDPFGRFSANLKTAGLIMAQAIPLMAILFLLFPRIEGSLFGLSMMSRAKSGFSDFMSPGSVSRLVENDDIAFRAEFEGGIPSPELRYWRGIVFESFDGRGWRTEKHVREINTPLSGTRPAAYTVHLEPHRSRWLFALEIPAQIPKAATLLRDQTLRSHRPVYKTFRYSLTSNTRYDNRAEDPFRLSGLTRLPEGENPQALQLAREIVENAPTVDEKISRVLDYFSKNGFAYTLEPPLLGRHPVDDFLFRSKKGYCEHYASAFAVMMRAANVPARVVGGYLGGEANPYGNFLTVRQTDAHAWTEVWHPERGWLRVDPTAAVAPERISRGSLAALASGTGAGGVMRQYFGKLTSVYDQVRFGWEALNAQFNAWFESYSHEQQRALLAWLGIAAESWTSVLEALAILMIALVAAVAGVVGFMVLRSPSRKPDAVRKHYTLFCEKLARAGFPRPSGMGPLDYAAFVSKNRPDLARRIHEITGLYVMLRYQDAPAKGALHAFIQKIKAFQPVLK